MSHGKLVYSSSVGLDLADGSLFRLLRSCVILMAHRGVGVIKKCIHLEDFFSTYRSKLLHSNLVFGSVPCQRCTFFFCLGGSLRFGRCLFFLFAREMLPLFKTSQVGIYP